MTIEEVQVSDDGGHIGRYGCSGAIGEQPVAVFQNHIGGESFGAKRPGVVPGVSHLAVMLKPVGKQAQPAAVGCLGLYTLRAGFAQECIFINPCQSIGYRAIRYGQLEVFSVHGFVVVGQQVFRSHAV